MVRLTDCVVDPESAEVRRPGRVERLTATEARLFTWLAEHPGATHTKDTLQTEVWGYRPGVVSRTVDTTVQRLRAKIEADPESPVHLLTVYGIGYRFVLPEVEQDDGLVGRDPLRAALVERVLGGARVVTLVGAPGVGKTRLADAVVQRVRGHFPDGALRVDAGFARDLPALVALLAGALGIPPEERRVARALARSDTLVFVDDLDPGLAAWLVEVDVRLLATAAAPLGVPGEVVAQVPPLPHADALRLLAARTTTRVADDPAITTLLDQLGGLPLAIELAAGRLALLRPAELSARLHEPGVLADPSRPGRHASLAATIAAAWEGLDEQDQEAMATLCSFAAPFSGAEGEDMLAERADSTPRSPVSVETSTRAADAKPGSAAENPGAKRPNHTGGGALDVLRTLEERGWLNRVPGDAIRLRVLPSVRAFVATNRPTDASVLQAWALRRSLDPDSFDADTWTNVLSGLRSSASPLAAQIFVAVSRPARRAGRGRALLDLPAPTCAPAVLGLWHARRAELVQDAGLDPTSALAAARACGGPEGEITLVEARQSRDRGDLVAAEAAFDRCLHLFVDERDLAAVRVELAGVRRAAGDANAALELLATAIVALGRIEGGARDLALAEGQRGVVLAAAGRHAEAEACYRRAIPALVSVNDVDAAGRLQGNLANLCLADGRIDEGERLLRRALATARRTGAVRPEAFYLLGLASAQAARGRYGEAGTLLQDARATFQLAAAAFPAAVCLTSAARVLHAAGNTTAAIPLYLAAEAELSALGRVRALERTRLFRRAAQGVAPEGDDAAACVARGAAVGNGAALRTVGNLSDRALLTE